MVRVSPIGLFLTELQRQLLLRLHSCFSDLFPGFPLLLRKLQGISKNDYPNAATRRNWLPKIISRTKNAKLLSTQFIKTSTILLVMLII